MPKTPTRRSGSRPSPTCPISWGPSAPARGTGWILPPICGTASSAGGTSCFRAAAEVLAQTAYAVFSGSEKAPAFDLALSGLNDSYEDRYGIYVYTGTTNTLEPLDRWLRYADLSRPVYVGGVVDYHA